MSLCTCTLFQVRIKLGEKNDIATIKDYLANSLQTNGPEPLPPKRPKRRGRFFKFFGPPRPRRQRKNARLAFEEIDNRINEETYGNRPNISNVCLLLVNEKQTSRYLGKSGINKFCDHVIVFSGEDEINLATIRKKICPEAEIIKGSNL